MRKIRRLKTVAEIVTAYNAHQGRGAFVRLIDCRKQRVTEWKANNRLPAKHYLVVKMALEKIGCAASPRLFGMREPGQKRAA